jgi:predicted RNA-binding protein with PUA-like domain
VPAFLVKTEPDEYAFEDLLREKRTRWSGVSNPAALIALRSMARGDEVFVYHTGGVKAIVGLAKVAREAYEDPEHPGLNARGEPARPVVDLEAVAALQAPVTLQQIKADRRFEQFALVRQARLSVMPVPAPLARAIRSMAGL